MKNGILFLVFILCCTALSAQQFSIQTLSDSRYTLSVSQREILQNKIVSWLTETGVVCKNQESQIIVLPEFLMGNQRTVQTGTRTLEAFDAELTLTLQQKNGGAIFGVYRKRLSGSGQNASAALSQMITGVPSNPDTQFRKFVEENKPKIVDFYTRNCSTILADAERLMQTNQTTQAVQALLSVPNGTDCRTQADAALINAYAKHRNAICTQSLLKARAAAANKQYKQAADALRHIDPNASCINDVQAFIKEMQTQNHTDFLVHWDVVKSYFTELASRQNWQLLLLNDYYRY